MSIKVDKTYDFKEDNGRSGESIKVSISEEDRTASHTEQGDPAIREFSKGSLRAITNQTGAESVASKWQPDPQTKAFGSAFSYKDALVKSKLPVQNFFVYDGAYAGLTDRGKIATSRDQILPTKRVTEQQCIEWNRIGSKKGWMFNGRPQSKYGHSGENKPTHTSDGYVESIRKNKWKPLTRAAAKQGLATREMPAIDIENNARGIGTTGSNSGSGGMAGGYREINKRRLASLPVPMAKYNWTGNRLTGTGREDRSIGHGAGGYRSGYASIYPTRPSFPEKRKRGVIQNAV
jgi:hypothetical protein